MIIEKNSELNKWNTNTDGQYIRRDNAIYLLKNLFEINGAIELSKSIKDASVSASIIKKLEDRKSEMVSQYGEYHYDDGSVLVCHPAIGYIEIETVINGQPRRLFASRIKSLTSNIITVYHADAYIAPNKTVTYVNKAVALEIEVSQSEFSSLLSSRGGVFSAGTIRNMNGAEIESVPDLNEMMLKNMMSEVSGAVTGFENLADRLLSDFNKMKAKGGKMNKRDVAALSGGANVINSWSKENPGFYVKCLAEMSGKTAAEVKIETLFLNGLMEK